MRVVFLATILFAALCAGEQPVHQTWQFFKTRHQKTYKSATEEEYRKKVFTANMKQAQMLEARNPSAKFGASPFADLTVQEFKRFHNADQYYKNRQSELKASKSTTKVASYWPLYSQEQIAAIPENVNWVSKGAVTPVKNQEQCGSCWAFSTTGGIEGQWFLAGHSLTSLSEQELVSCDTIDDGCNGGLMNNAYDWLLQNRQGKISTEASYPYVSGMGNVPACNLAGKTVGATINGHYNIYHSETQMAAWVAEHGPLSIAVDATAWQLYFGGIMTDCGGSQLDHGVLIVAYGISNDTSKIPYWLIKNSWGASWGDQGYIPVARGSDQCLLSHYPVTSTVVGSKPAPPEPTNVFPVTAGYFVHSVFDDQNCTQGRWNLVWKQGECVIWDGVSFTATCTATDVEFAAYPKSLDCSGTVYKTTEKINTCFVDNNDFCYSFNKCPDTVTQMEQHPRAVSNLLKKFKSVIQKP